MAACFTLRRGTLAPRKYRSPDLIEVPLTQQASGRPILKVWIEALEPRLHHTGSVTLAKKESDL